MFAEIAYNAHADNNAERILVHIIELLTGTTTIGALTGGNIDSGNSSIDVSYHTPSYVLHDDISATNKVLKIPVHDDGGTFFYLEFTVVGTDIDMQIWEGWSGGVGTGGSTYYASSGFEFVTVLGFATNAFTLYFTVTATHCLARSVYNGGTKKYCRGFIQYERREFWDTVANGHIPVIITFQDTLCQNTTQAYAMPHRRSDDIVYSAINAKLYMATAYGSCQLDAFINTLGNNSSNARGLNASNDSIHNMYEFGFSYISSGERFLSGKVFDMFLATYSNGAFGDTVSVNSLTHIIWEVNINYRFAIRKG